MATQDADPREAAKARERQIDDGVFLGGDDFPSSGPSDTDADLELDGPGEPDPVDDPTADDEPTAFEWPEGLEVPERLKGKSAADIAKEFASLQTEFGRQTTELGENRAALRDILREQLIHSRQPQTEPEKRKAVKFEDLEENADETIRGIVQDALREALGPVQEQTQQAQLAAQVAEFQSKHPDFQSVVQSQEFKDWVGKSTYRKRLYDKNLDGYDFDAADELLNGYREYAEAQKGSEDDAQQVQRVRGKATVKGGGGGKPAAKRGQVYSWEKLRRLYITDRDSYNALLPELEKAEKEGRIK